MSVAHQPYRIGQSVRILPGSALQSAPPDVYTILRCNEADSSNPSYVIQSAVDRRQRRELHSRLSSVATGETTGS